MHGCSILNDIWNVTERPDFHSSPAIKTCVNQSLDQAEISLSDIKHFDLYSCFLQQYKLQKRIGYSEKKRFNGYGRFALLWRPWKFLHDVFNYEMVRQLRKKPQTYGLLTANSWFIHKHAALVMSTIPAKPFEKINNSSVKRYQFKSHSKFYGNAFRKWKDRYLYRDQWEKRFRICFNNRNSR